MLAGTASRYGGCGEEGKGTWHCLLLHSLRATQDLFPELFAKHNPRMLTLHKLQYRINGQMKKVCKCRTAREENRLRGDSLLGFHRVQLQPSVPE